jgi:Tol biopolymer transport system component
VPSSLLWIDRNGGPAGELAGVADYGDVTISPDGTRVALTIAESESCCRRDVWTIDVGTGARTRLTSSLAPKWAVTWSPDGSRVAFSSDAGGSSDIYEAAADGSGIERPLLATRRHEVSWEWAPVGFLLYAGDRVGTAPGSHQDLWARRLPQGRPFTYLRSVHRAEVPTLSPDGRWVAFVLTPAGGEHGDGDVYIARFPKYTGRWRVTNSGGRWPRWRGSSLYFVDREQRLNAVPVAVRGTQIAIGAASRVADAVLKPGPGYSYDVSPDGQRILLNTVLDTPVALSRREP